MKKWMIRALSALLIAAFLPASVLADEYNLDEGSVTVSTSEGKEQTVTQNESTKPDSNPIITSKGTETKNTITIHAEAYATANVTIKDTNIKTDNAAIKTEGYGSVNLNVEGTNTVSSGENHAGVEKSNGCNLTIGSESGNGKLTANGGRFGAGIGGGYNQDGSYITITGGEVTANGGEYGAGIGGGNRERGNYITITGGEVTANGGRLGAGIGGGYGDDGSHITISGGEVTAKGGDCGAGIGGGDEGDGSNIAISGGEVTANGGKHGAGIGGGLCGSGSDITISGDSQVKATGGAESSYDGCGAAIGNGENSKRTDGSEVEPDTSGLYTTGKVERTHGDGTVLDPIIGTVEPPKPDEPEESAPSEEEPDKREPPYEEPDKREPLYEEPDKREPLYEGPVKREPLYRVLHLDWSSLKHQEKKADGVLALTAEADGAILTGKLWGLGYLQNQGIEKITFTDGTHSAELVLSELIAKGKPGDVYVLTLGAENTLTLNGEAIDF